MFFKIIFQSEKDISDMLDNIMFPDTVYYDYEPNNVIMCCNLRSLIGVMNAIQANKAYIETLVEKILIVLTPDDLNIISYVYKSNKWYI